MNKYICVYIYMQWGHAMAQLVETLRFKPHYGPGVDSAFNRNEYQEYFVGIKAAGA
jgi:hypothetical protein